METTHSSLINALIILKYSSGHWTTKNYFGFPIPAFYDTLDEMISSDFTEFVVVVYKDDQGKFERAVVEKGGWREFNTKQELLAWLKEMGAL